VTALYLRNITRSSEHWNRDVVFGAPIFSDDYYYRLAYSYDFGVRLTICWAILRPYDCCEFPYDSGMTITDTFFIRYIILQLFMFDI